MAGGREAALPLPVPLIDTGLSPLELVKAVGEAACPKGLVIVCIYLVS